MEITDEFPIAFILQMAVLSWQSRDRDPKLLMLITLCPSKNLISSRIESSDPVGPWLNSLTMGLFCRRR